MTDGSGGITPIGRPGHALVPGQAVRRLPAEAAVPRGPAPTGCSNGGVFVRFPDPRVPLAQRTEQCSKYGAPRRMHGVGRDLLRPRDPALRRRARRRDRKTGSIYTSTNTIDEIGDAQAGASGRTTRSRSSASTTRSAATASVINEFDNTPGHELRPRRRPDTTLRQFTQRLHRPAEPRRRGHDAVPQRPRPGPHAGRADRQPDRGVHGRRATAAHGRGPLDRRGRQRRGQRKSFDVRDRWQRCRPARAPAPLPSPPTPSTILPPLIDTPASFRLGRCPRAITRTTFARRGVSVPVACTGAMTGSAKLTVSSARRASGSSSSARTIDAEDVQCWGPHTARVTLKPSSAIAKRSRARAVRRA